MIFLTFSVNARIYNSCSSHSAHNSKNAVKPGYVADGTIQNKCKMDMKIYLATEIITYLLTYSMVQSPS